MLFFIIVSGCNSNSFNDIIYVNQEEELQTFCDRYQKPLTIGFIPKISSIPYYKAVKEGAIEAENTLGVKVYYTNSNGTYIEQMNAIEELIQLEVDAIAVSAADPYKLLPVLQKARKHNIKIVTWDSDVDPTGRDFFVNSVDPEILGRHLMDNLALTINEKGSYAIITSTLNSANTNEWIKWMKIQQKEYYPHLTLKRIITSDDNDKDAYEAAKYLLQEYPNLSAIVGLSTVAPSAAARAVIESVSSNVQVLGLSLPNTMRNFIEAGITKNITLWSPQKLGYLTIALTKNSIEGQFPQDQQKIPKVGNIRVRDNVVIMGEPIIFTKENIDQYDF